MPKWKMASSTDTSVSFYPLELLVEIPRVPKDASRGSEKKGGILIIKETEKASLERFRINVRTKALNSEPVVT